MTIRVSDMSINVTDTPAPMAAFSATARMTASGLLWGKKKVVDFLS